MRKIYFEKRCIIICPAGDLSLADSNAILFHAGERIDIHALIGMFESSESLMKIYIPSVDEEETYRRICAEFKEVTAGG